jgi:hypothetical protein
MLPDISAGRQRILSGSSELFAGINQMMDAALRRLIQFWHAFRCVCASGPASRLIAIPHRKVSGTFSATNKRGFGS